MGEEQTSQSDDLRSLSQEASEINIKSKLINRRREKLIFKNKPRNQNKKKEGKVSTRINYSERLLIING